MLDAIKCFGMTKCPAEIKIPPLTKSSFTMFFVEEKRYVFDKIIKLTRLIEFIFKYFFGLAISIVFLLNTLIVFFCFFFCFHHEN